MIARYAREAGFAPADIHMLAPKQFPRAANVVIRLRGKGHGKPILYICHMDVVPANPADWSLPPFKFTEQDGYYYGRGASDMKNEDAAVLASLIRLKREGYVPERDIIVAFTADEEVGLDEDGVAFLMREHRPLVDAEFVINPDGGAGAIQRGRRIYFGVQTSEKVYVTFTASTFNRGGHSSEPRPDNAIYQLAAGLVRFSKYQFPFHLNPTTRSYFAHMATLQTRPGAQGHAGGVARAARHRGGDNGLRRTRPTIRFCTPPASPPSLRAATPRTRCPSGRAPSSSAASCRATPRKTSSARSNALWATPVSR